MQEDTIPSYMKPKETKVTKVAIQIDRPVKKKLLRLPSKTLDNLYNDAFKRMQNTNEKKKIQEEELKHQQQQSHVNNVSNRLVAEKLIKEFEELSDIFFQPDQEHRFNYLQMTEFMAMLKFNLHSIDPQDKNFVKERTLLHDMWLVLMGDHYGGINERNLLQFLLAIVGFNFDLPPYVRPDHLESETNRRNLPNSQRQTPKNVSNESRPQNISPATSSSLRRRSSIEDPSYEKAVERINERKSATYPTPSPFGRFDDKENISFSPEEAYQIHKYYQPFFINRIAETKSARNSKSPVRQEDLEPKSPLAIPKSQVLAEKYRRKQLEDVENYMFEANLAFPADEKITHAELLRLHSAAQMNKVRNKILEEREEEFKNYTFKPKVNSVKAIEKLRSLACQGDKSPRRRSRHRGSQSPRGSKRSQRRSVSPVESVGTYRTEILYSLRKPFGSRTNKTRDEWDEEKHGAQCTFKPKLCKNRSVDRNKSLDLVRNAERSVERVRKAREQQEFIDWVKKPRAYDLSEGNTSLNCSTEKKHNKSGFDDLNPRKRSASNTSRDALDTSYHSYLARKFSESRILRDQSMLSNKSPRQSASKLKFS